jgi:hypothetical protein
MYELQPLQFCNERESIAFWQQEQFIFDTLKSPFLLLMRLLYASVFFSYAAELKQRRVYGIL